MRRYRPTGSQDGKPGSSSTPIVHPRWMVCWARSIPHVWDLVTALTGGKVQATYLPSLLQNIIFSWAELTRFCCRNSRGTCNLGTSWWWWRRLQSYHPQPPPPAAGRHKVPTRLCRRRRCHRPSSRRCRGEGTRRGASSSCGPTTHPRSNGRLSRSDWTRCVSPSSIRRQVQAYKALKIRCSSRWLRIQDCRAPVMPRLGSEFIYCLLPSSSSSCGVALPEELS